MFDDLVINAAVGTARKPPELPAAEGALGEALGAVASLPPEAKLLLAMAIGGQYESSGRLPQPAPPTPEPAAAEIRPLCSRRAADLLAQILSMTNVPTKHALAGEWLSLAAAAGQRPPHLLLPVLLDYGAAYRAPRQLIGEVCGARGGWLMRLNPRWQFAAAEQLDLHALWSTGKREQRVSAISRLRQSDPAGARELIASTWKEDDADDRAAFVATLQASLSDADEPFLESALDDRSKQVRAAAVNLLARLPGSAFVRRMIQRADPLLTYQSGRKGKPGTIGVSLPPDQLDPSWSRDGIVEKPEEKLGRRQWWLRQVLAAVPTTHWSGKWGVDADTCVAAARGEFVELLLAAWNQSQARLPDPLWVKALVLAGAKDERLPLDLSLLNALPADAQQAVTIEVLASPRLDFALLQQFLAAATFAFTEPTATALYDALDRLVSRAKGRGAYYVAQALDGLACRVPPASHDELAERWSGPRWADSQRELDQFFQTLLVRRDMQHEFAPTPQQGSQRQEVRS